jgi:hypothetical protein
MPHLAAGQQGTIVPLPDKDREMLDTYLGKGVVGRPVEARPLTEPLKWMPLEKNTWRYRMTYGDLKGQIVEDRVSRLEQPASGAEWKLELDKTEILFLRKTPSGDVVCATHSDLNTGMDSVNDPPALQVVQGMKPEQSVEKHFSVKVFDPREPSKVKYNGGLDLTLTYVGAYEVTTPAGRFEAVLIKSICRGEVGPATVMDVRYRLYAQGAGMVAMVKDKLASAYLFFGDHSKTGKVLLEIPKKATTEAPAAASRTD